MDNSAEPDHSEIQLPNDIEFSFTKIRIFMANVDKCLAVGNELDGSDPEVVNAVIANMIADAKERGSREDEYLGWAVLDELTDSTTIRETKRDRKNVELPPISSNNRSNLIKEKGEMFASVVREYTGEVEGADVEDEEEIIGQQDEALISRIRDLVDANKLDKWMVIGLAILLEAATVPDGAEDVTKVTINRCATSAVKALHARLANSRVGTDNTALVEKLIRFRKEGDGYSKLAELIDEFEAMYSSPKKDETPTATYYRLRDMLMSGLEELYRTP